MFCLLSRCESFGIPAVEAQSFGTPALGTDTCAIPEVGGRGGLYSPVDDVEAAANNLIRVLRDQGPVEPIKSISDGKRKTIRPGPIAAGHYLRSLSESASHRCRNESMGSTTCVL